MLFGMRRNVTGSFLVSPPSTAQTGFTQGVVLFSGCSGKQGGSLTVLVAE